MVQGLASERQIVDAIRRAPNSTGVGVLRDVIGQAGGLAPTRSEAERRLLKLVDDAQLPTPLANARLGGRELDFLWPEERLVVEVDGFRFHGHRVAFERDRRRDATLVAGGYRVIRVTWRQITEEPLALVASLAQGLGAGV
jgi:very-short-patch-repair endonuclease